MDPKPHQVGSFEDTLAAFADGHPRIVVAIPTGGGKSLVQQMLARERLNRRLPVALFTHRTMLTEQVSDGLMDERLYHGVRAAYDLPQDAPDSNQLEVELTEWKAKFEAWFRSVTKRPAAKE